MTTINNDREVKMFGVAVAELVQLRNDRQTDDAGREGMAATDAKVAMSILSDVQEMLTLGFDQRAILQTINRAKFFLGEIVRPGRS